MSQHSQIQAIYNEGYSKFLDVDKIFRLKKVIKIIKKLNDISVAQNDADHSLRLLDVGCGDGSFTLEMSRALSGQWELHGVDISKNAAELAKSHGILATSLNTDFECTPYPDGYFNLIFCGSLIEVVLNPDKLIEELKRIISPNGYIVFTYPNHTAWLSRIAVLFGRLPYYYRVSTKYEMGKLGGVTIASQSTGFIRLFTSNAFLNLMNLNNFLVFKLLGAREHALPKALYPIDCLMQFFPSLAFQNIVVVKKK